MAKPRVKDRWKLKKWYRILAPKVFNEVEVGETPADDPRSVIGREVEVDLSMLGDGDPNAQYKLFVFRIVDVKGENAYTAVKEYYIARELEKTLVRRRHTRVDNIEDLTTKDGKKIRLKTMVIAVGNLQTTREEEIRRKVKEALKELEKEDLDSIVKKLASGELNKLIFNAAKKISPVRFAEVRKLEVLSF